MVYYDAGQLTYREWNGSLSSNYSVMAMEEAPRISTNEDDIYTLCIADDGSSGYELRMRQRDYNPSKLTSFAGTWSSSHPKVTWDASEATDFKEYVVEKSSDGVNFSTRATISSRSVTSYTDASEYQYSPGNTKSHVWYRTYQKDLQDNVSEKTANKSFTVNGPQNSVNQLIVSTDIKLADFVLAENYPNPFNPETKISFGLPEQSNVSLKVYNIQGQVVATLADGVKQDGYYTTSFDGSALSSGVYIYRFAARGLESGKVHNEIKRMLLIK
jgi:type IX secretion system substrate protein